MKYAHDAARALRDRSSAPICESLEPRKLLAAYVVDTALDVVDAMDGLTSLREAVIAANASTTEDDTISFANALAGATITLAGGELPITDALTISGLGADNLTIDADGLSRVFNIDDSDAGNINTVVIENIALTNGTTGADGGAIFSNERLTLSNVAITGSQADNGGALAGAGFITIESSTLSGNNATTDGGAIQAGFAFLSIESTTIAGNTAGNDGGAISLGSSQLTIESSTLSGNNAGNNGAGIQTSASDATLTNATLSGNTATNTGGGAYFDAGTQRLQNTTVTRNTANTTGGGLAIVNGASTRIISTILSGNATLSVANEVSGTLDPTSNNNLIQTASTAGGLTNTNNNLLGVDPLIDDLADNGAPTQTHRPAATSPIIDAGTNPASATTDQRGSARVSGAAADIGAFELQQPDLNNLVPSLTTLAQGEPIALTANLTDTDEVATAVRFYIDANNNGIADPSELLAEDTDGTDGWIAALSGADTAAIADGTATFLAVMLDGTGDESAPASASATLNYSIRAGDGSNINTAVTADDRHIVGLVNEAGDPVILDTVDNTAEQLANSIGAPKALDDLIIWTDPNDGLIKAAYPSADGLILLTRAANGDWSFQNLNDDAAGSLAPVRDLTQFASTNNEVVIAGITADDKIVAFQQNGDAYDFVNITDDHLVPQGFTNPVLTDLISYRPAWNAWHLAGLDAAGDIISVWIAPSFDQWRLDNLSDLTGAPPLAGGLSVILTSWSGINLTGLDNDGDVVVTWWVPEFAGSWEATNLTNSFGGPTLAASSLTGYYTGWDGMNYAGVDDDGRITIYWWVPSFGGRWEISPITGIGNPNNPTGDVTSLASEAGTLNILGTNATNDAVRAYWQPGGAWTIDNLSDTATRL